MQQNLTLYHTHQVKPANIVRNSLNSGRPKTPRHIGVVFPYNQAQQQNRIDQKQRMVIVQRLADFAYTQKTAC